MTLAIIQRATAAFVCLLIAGAQPALARDDWALPADRTIPASPPPGLADWRSTAWWTFLAYCGLTFSDEYVSAPRAELLNEFMEFQTAAKTRLQRDRRIAPSDAEELVYAYAEYAAIEFDTSFATDAAACRAGLRHHNNLGA